MRILNIPIIQHVYYYKVRFLQALSLETFCCTAAKAEPALKTKPILGVTTTGGDVRSIYLFHIKVKGTLPILETLLLIHQNHIRVVGNIERHLLSNHKPALR